MRSIHDQALKIAQVDLPALLLGETGTGKWSVARLIHDLSPRRDGPFQELRCSDFREDALERELFGSIGKDNTGLRHWQLGRLITCRGGTLALKEITALPWRLQARLVDVLDSHRLLAVGGYPQTPLDVRILATTREDVAESVASGKLRRDLYYRLQALTLSIPRLRKPREEGAAFSDHLAPRQSHDRSVPAPPKLATLRGDCLHRPWPGNFREFEVLARRFFALG